MEEARERLQVSRIVCVCSFIFYTVIAQAANTIRLDSFVPFVNCLLQSNSYLLGQMQQYRHILVDESQDTDPAQYEFIRLVAGRSGHVTFVGDIDQSIYGFRGADV